jgi:hypothetical protein
MFHTIGAKKNRAGRSPALFDVQYLACIRVVGFVPGAAAVDRAVACSSHDLDRSGRNKIAPTSGESVLNEKRERVT